MVSRKYDQLHFFKLLLFYKVRKTKKERDDLSLEIFSYLTDIIRKSKRKLFERLQKFKAGVIFKNDNDMFYEDSDIENESFICLIKCLNNFKIVKEVKQKGTFLGYYKISLERHLNRHLIEKVFSAKEHDVNYDAANCLASDENNLFENFSELEKKIILNHNNKNKNYKTFCMDNSITVEEYRQKLDLIRKKYENGF